MRFIKGIPVIVFSVLAILLCAAGPVQTQERTECTQAAFEALGLTDEGGQPVTITSAEIKTTHGTVRVGEPPVTTPVTVPEHCYVTGMIVPQIQFHVALPMAWNNRFFMPGGGGFNGTLPSLTVPLLMGYSTAGTDSGHSTSIDPDDGPQAKFAYPDSDPVRHQKKIDFAYRSYRETAVLAKTIINKYYGTDPLYSYWVGCSEGGREALMMAQRFPELFDGIIAGAPISYLTRAHMWSVWNPFQLWDGVERPGTPGQIMGPNQLPALAKAVYDKCDAGDGLTDGLINDPRNCNFDATKDLPICDTATDTCFTMAQAVAIHNIHDGVRNSAGELLFPGQPPGAEVLTATVPTPDGATSGWSGWIVGNPYPSRQQSIGESSMQFFSLTPQPGPDWNFYDFDYDNAPQRLLETSAMVDMINPDLTAFKNRGGKMIHYHGWADPALTPLMTTNYFESVLSFMGETSTSEFYKLYMVPGMFHCSGGVGCWDGNTTLPRNSPTPAINPNGNQLKFFSAVVDWVEYGTIPYTFIGTRAATDTGLTARTRPLCPYPTVERYLGSGNIDEAENFVCVIPANVRIEPETFNLKSQGVFTAFITYPPGYPASNWQITKVVCEGATAVRGMVSEEGYIAKFHRQDVQGMVPGSAVPFTVTATAEYNGQKVLFEGSDTVRVGLHDVPMGHWADHPILAISNKGITGGCSNDPPSFCPDAAITRGQMAVFLVASLGQSPTSCTGRFTDVPIGDPFCGFAEQLAANGITGGCGGGRFCPNDPITRGQMAVFLEAALGHSLNPCTGRFADVPSNHPFCGFIEGLADDGITGGCGPGVFCPGNSVTRAEIAVFLVAAPPPLNP